MKIWAILATAGFALTLHGYAAAQSAAPPESPAAIESEAHGGYVEAINSNDPDKLAAVLSEDVVYQFPGAPELIGKDAVMDWVRGYFAAYSTRWEKTSRGFAANGDLAVERYTYKATDTDRKTGATTTDVGKGINVFRRGADGKWRVSVDGWSSDRPAT